MVLLDTNIFIYLANGSLGSQAVARLEIAHSSITEIEALGFSDLAVNEFLLLSSLFGESHALTLTDAIVERAIKLRQTRAMGLGDSIIAATALEHNLVLWTANDKDFSHLAELKIMNPINRRS